MALGDAALVKAVLDDWRTAAVDGKVRATLALLEKLTLAPNEVGPADIAPLRAAGIRDRAIADAVHVCALFNVINRIADALGFVVLSPGRFRLGAQLVLKHGYQLQL